MFIYTIYDCKTNALAQPKLCPLPWPDRGNLGMLFLSHCAANPDKRLVLVMFLPNKKPVSMVQPIEHSELSDYQLDLIESRARELLSERSH